jgi:hypothetical protein
MHFAISATSQTGLGVAAEHLVDSCVLSRYACVNNSGDWGVAACLMMQVNCDPNVHAVTWLCPQWELCADAGFQL